MCKGVNVHMDFQGRAGRWVGGLCVFRAVCAQKQGCIGQRVCTHTHAQGLDNVSLGVG